MTAFYPGSCVVRGYAFLKRPRYQANQINSFVLDAAIAGSSYTLVDHVLYGTMQVDENLLHRFIDARVYTIEAKARTAIDY